MRISFDTQEDTYEDALAVLHRAYGRRGPARKPDASQAGATPEKTVATKKAPSHERNKTAAKRPSATSNVVTSTEARGRGEMSAPPVRQKRSTSEPATGKARPMRRTAKGSARKAAPSKAATSKAAQGEKAAGTSVTAKKPGTTGAVTRKAARGRAPSESVAERQRRLTRTKSAAGLATNVAPPGQSEAVRAWARAQGLSVSDRGRMPASVIAAFEAAHKA